MKIKTGCHHESYNKQVTQRLSQLSEDEKNLYNIIHHQSNTKRAPISTEPNPTLTQLARKISHKEGCRNHHETPLLYTSYRVKEMLNKLKQLDLITERHQNHWIATPTLKSAEKNSQREQHDPKYTDQDTATVFSTIRTDFSKDPQPMEQNLNVVMLNYAKHLAAQRQIDHIIQNNLMDNRQILYQPKHSEIAIMMPMCLEKKRGCSISYAQLNQWQKQYYHIDINNKMSNIKFYMSHNKLTSDTPEQITNPIDTQLKNLSQ
ncbi:hypothetical protein ACQZV8_18130 [Magnetococcales bacterium HHB-1]